VHAGEVSGLFETCWLFVVWGIDSTFCRFIVLKAAHSSTTFLAVLCYLDSEAVGVGQSGFNEVVKSDFKGSNRDDRRGEGRSGVWSRCFGRLGPKVVKLIKAKLNDMQESF
jgi:hypothetical protein